MFRRHLGSTGAVAVAGTTLGLGAVPTTTFTAGFQGRGAANYKSVFLRTPEVDRADLQQIFPTVKPKLTAGMPMNEGTEYYAGFSWHEAPDYRDLARARVITPVKAKVVTVYGASGFLGINIVRELLAHPEIKTVRACTRYPTHIAPGSDLDKLLQEDHGDRLELHECDITNRLQVNVAANGADTLICAFDYFVQTTNNSYANVFCEGYQNIGLTAKNCGCERVILAGNMHNHLGSWSSWSDFEAQGEEAASNNFLDCCLIRFGTLYGDGYRYRGLGKYFYTAVFPDTQCQPLWVKDAARAVVLAARSDRVCRARMDLGGPETMSHLEFVRRLAKNYNPRFIIGMRRSLGVTLAKCMGWLLPNVVDEHYVNTWELDQVTRPASLFTDFHGWDKLEYQPKTMEEARKIEKTGTDLKSRSFESVADAEDLMLVAEERDKAAFMQEEIDARKKGIWRAVASWSGGTEVFTQMENEIYPGGQFRYQPLHDATYAENAPSPGPSNAF